MKKKQFAEDTRRRRALSLIRSNMRGFARLCRGPDPYFQGSLTFGVTLGMIRMADLAGLISDAEFSFLNNRLGRINVAKVTRRPPAAIAKAA
jgi:hypothetical protein